MERSRNSIWRGLFSVETWPEPAAQAWLVAQRFQKFLIVGIVGLAVNQGMLFLLHSGFSVPLTVASPLAIFVSMIVTFILNERWTWHDRGTGPVLHRMLFYFPINIGGLLINFAVLTYLVNQFDMHYLLANLVGAGCAAIWNFTLNHHLTWGK